MNKVMSLLLDHPPKAWLVLAFSLLVTWFAWHVSSEYAEKRIEERFGFETADLQAAIAKRMQDQEEVLRGGVGLFAASDEVNRSEWRRYAESLNLAHYYPGLQGFGYAELVAPEALVDHEARIRAEGFPDFNVRPPGDRETYTSIVYLEPFDWRNQRAFGFDMFSEANRRAAMTRARDTGQPAMSGIVTLVQETDTNVQRGFLLYLPVYRNGAPVGSVEERRAALEGWVYSPFRMNDLMQGIVGAGNDGIAFALYDGTTVSDDSLLYQSSADDTGDMPAATPDRLELTTEMEFAGRVWTADFWAKPDYLNAIEKDQPLFIAAAGLLLDLTIFLVISSISRRHRSIAREAEALTVEYRLEAEKTQAVVDAVGNGILSISENGVIRSANPAAAQIFGIPADALRNRHFATLLTANTRAIVNSRIGTLAELTAPIRFAEEDALFGLRHDGSFVPLELSITPLGLQDRLEYSLVFTELTERQRNDRLKSEFVSTVSHELRTPLTSIRGAVGLIAAGVAGEVPKQVTELAEIAHGNCERMTNIINDILDLQKINSGRLEMHFASVNVAGMVEDAVTANRIYAENHGITLTAQDIEPALAVNADVDRLMQVLSNLLSNAIKFSARSGDVEIAARRDGTDVIISVIDHGIGIDEDFKAKIFDHFARADNSNTRTVDGTGLGLAISRKLIEAMAGSIWFDTELGVGTTFHVRLPQAGTGMATQETADTAPLAEGVA